MSLKGSGLLPLVYGVFWLRPMAQTALYTLSRPCAVDLVDAGGSINFIILTSAGAAVGGLMGSVMGLLTLLIHESLISFHRTIESIGITYAALARASTFA
ncbi:hypothetical protein FOZ63_026985 [Perkinsus olseni]|uniref:Uncharacterized protein n=1 Tax=Perkinsus olseni TaxID=32597 RepID=A0A7J6QYD0_PEROL|nr:hypothetical protein FOZ62_018807 [Perkinsus olseni]KAF4713424.1 hypothetical protein FOZ63_026985 [Perkinsus olseni]